MEMDWAHPPKTTQQHHQAGSDLEPTRQTKKGSTKEHLAEGPGGGHPTDGLQLEGAGETGPGPWTLEECRRWPLPREGEWA